MNRRTRAAGLALHFFALMMCISMAALAAAQASEPPGARIAVLENRVDQIDKHLQNTDLIEDKQKARFDDQQDKLIVRLDEQQKEIVANTDAISGMQNDSQWERRIGWAIISLLTGGSMVSNWRKKAKEAIEG